MNIYLKDTDDKFKHLPYVDAQYALTDAGEWAKGNCDGFLGYEVIDVSDVSSAACDWMGEYRFNSEKGAAWFKLKWS
jgi:hypothetical protein